MSLESPQHECAVIGIFSPHSSVSQDIYYGLVAQQNRGQEGSGAATFDSKGQMRIHKDVGLVYAVFKQEDIDRLEGGIGVGHNRYGTTGSSSRKNAQPFIATSDLGSFAFVHNGNIFNADELREKLINQGSEFSSTSDSEVIAELIAKSPGRTMVEKIKEATPRLKGAYSFVIATPDSLIGVRDPHGFWPLSLGKINGSGYVFASETNAIHKVGGEFLRDVQNGEVVVVDHEGLSCDTIGQQKSSLCSFEYYYFSDPFSVLMGKRVENTRFEMGRRLAKEHYFEADWVLPVPETARPAAEGYAYESKIPVRGALVRNRWLGRSFIEPSQRLRELAASLKYGALSEVINGGVINVVDDSIVRGTTTKRLINLLRRAGAKEVNVLITAPPIVRECWFGVDTANGDELIAAKMEVEEIKSFIGADRLGYLSLDSGLDSIGREASDQLCTSCFTGKYGMQVPSGRDRFILERVK